MSIATLPRVTAAALAFCCSFLTGCVADRAYQPLGSSVPQYTAPAIGNDVAVIEFNGAGQLHSCCGTQQVDFATQLIASARETSPHPEKVVVLTFIHGNQNNASLSVDNYPHFLQLIDCLNSGSADFKAHMLALPANSALARRYARFKNDSVFHCGAIKPTDGTRYVGVYIGWRGSLNTIRADFQQKAAVRVGDGADILMILRRLRNAAKPISANTPNSLPSRLVILGHSFGGLIVERAIYRLYDPLAGTSADVQPFADLVMTFNEATNGVLAKRLIEKTNGYSVTSLTPGYSGMPVRPVLIGIHSKTDPLTGPVGTVGRFLIPTPYPRDNGVFAEPNYPQSGDKPDAGKINRSTPSNLLFFDSVCYLDAPTIAVSKNNISQGRHDFVAGDPPGCDDVSDVLAEGKVQPGKLQLFPSPPAQVSLSNLYRRVQFLCRGKAESRPDGTSIYKWDTRERCKPDGRDSDEHDFTLLPWNRSAYWMVNVPDNVIHSHGGYWSENSVLLIQELIQEWPVLKRADVLP